jgi:hypothetical protein
LQPYKQTHLGVRITAPTQINTFFHQYDPVNFVVVISGMTLFAFLSIISVCAHSFCKKGAGKDDTTLFTKLYHGFSIKTSFN